MRPESNNWCIEEEEEEEVEVDLEDIEELEKQVAVQFWCGICPCFFVLEYFN